MKKTRKQYISFILLGIVFLVGCSNSKKSEEEPDTTTSTPTATLAPTAATETLATADNSALILPLTTNDSGKVMIQTVSKSSTYGYNSYIITSSNGETIVLDPTDMPSKDIIDLNPAAILSTHGHPDHTDANFTSSYDTKTVLYTKEDFDLKGFHIYSIYSSHSGDTISNNNVIFVLEVDGLRIAHMGDIGQTTLTEEQLKELGTIDIAFMQFENSYSDMNLTNLKGFNLIEQLNPKIVIPTHYGDKALPILEENYGAITEYDNVLTISKEDLPENTLNVYRVLNNHVYQ